MKRRRFGLGFIGSGLAVAAVGLAPVPGRAAETIDGNDTVSVPGTHASPWSIPDFLIVGQGSNGTLNIDTGGAVNVGSGPGASNFIRLGDNGSTGTVNVSGTGALLTSTNFLTLGLNGGTGVLNISNGGRVEGRVSLVGRAGSTGELTLTGPDSIWVTDENAFIGEGGDGTATVADGATAISGAGFIGGTATGEMTVRDAGSSWSITDRLEVGNNGTGTLTVESGGLVSASNVIAGDQAGSSGSILLDSDGTLEAGQVERGAGSGMLDFDGGVLRLTGDQADLFSGFAAGDVTLAAGGGTIDTQSHEASIAVEIDGTGGLTKEGSGTTILTGDNSYSGGTTIATGTLQIGNGGTAGAITGDVNNNGSLVFNRSDAITFSGVVSGTGSLEQAGGSGLTLTGDSSHSGGTVISAGTLQLGDGGATGSVTGDIANSGTLIVDRSNAIGLSGIISGTGGVEQAGAGITTLSGTNTYTGGTGVTAGTLQISADNNLGGAAGGLTLDGGALNTTADISSGRAISLTGTGRVITDAGTTLTLSSPLTGTGALDKDGAGTLTLTDDATYAGDTTITAGTLQLGNGGTTGSIAGDVTNDGNLVLDRSDATTFAGVISGGGALSQTGSGTTVLTGTNTYSGGTTIADGTLQIGAGGTSGSINGDVTSDGTLVFDRSDSLTFAGLVSGGGTLEQNGAGTTVLSGDNSYTGATTVNAGMLIVNGAQSAATGLATVNAGAALGGTGTLGGSVDILGGGAVAPGEVGTDPGTLTVNGDLSLDAASTLDFELGEADSPGGPLNDLIEVGGDLTLDGTLDVATSPGGSFDTGLYRIIDYDGTLTDDGLTVGTIPSPDFYVQTSVDNQVNLVNTSGLTLRYWDGEAGPKNDGFVDGDDGLWQDSSGNDNWVDEGSIPNAPFSDDAFAIFAGTGGTVDVDNSQGTVSAGGMQFATDGYVIADEALTLAGPQSIVRVGDGTTAGGAYTATVSSVVTGATELVKTDLGTLVLSAANNYSGGTAIRNGTLEISSDDNLGEANGGLSFDGGTLRTTADLGSNRNVTLAGDGALETAAGTTLTLGGDVAGAGALTKSGAGTTIITQDAAYTGGTAIAAGTLQLGDGGTSGAVEGDIDNEGLLVFNRSDQVAVSGAISGGGAVSQAGPGTVILTAANSYAGGTTIATGTLQLGDGGTSGSVTGDIVNDGTLAFNRSDDVTFDGVISGDGTVLQGGGGTTVLTGANSYGGATTVDAGILRINGDQAAATGLTTVDAGGTLGGVGTLGGDATVADGGTLAPGNSPGTLTVNGDLTLDAGAILDFELGEADVAGGPLNDLIEVGGDLTLDGTLDVTTSPGGTFGPGIYRLIDYDGALTDHGLSLGSMPAGADPVVQTSIARQVNLINLGGLALNYWDGPAGAENDGTISGGDGTWTAAVDGHWTESSGGINASYADGAFAVFSGTAGTVTVDNSEGDVRADGMQFAVDGYEIAGDALTLIGPQSTVRVGDGTEDGAAYTATVSAALTGATGLVKTDSGTLVLSGANTWSGGTAINGGTLQVSGDDALGDAAGGLSFDGGALRTTADIASEREINLAGDGTIRTEEDTTLTLSGPLSGGGDMSKTGAGFLVLTGDSGGYGGASRVLGGTLVVDGVLGGAVDVHARLGGRGSVGTLRNHADGVVAPGHDGDFGTLTVTGDYMGDGGMLEIETALAGDGSPTDRLTVGGATSGTTRVSVVNRGGLGGQTEDGIRIIEVAGASDGAFTLDGDYVFEGDPAVVGGAYSYRLYQNGIDTPADGDWYLRSSLTDPPAPDGPDPEPEPEPSPAPGPLYQPGVPLYEAYTGVLQSFNTQESLRQRVGGRVWQGTSEGNGVWARIEAGHRSLDPKLTTSGTEYDVDRWQVQAGADAELREREGGRLVAGLSARYGTLSGDVSSLYGTGRIRTDGYGLRATLTWYSTNGFYVDGQADATWYDSDLVSHDIGDKVAESNDAFGYATSIEVGQRVAVASHWALVPQLQWSYAAVDFDTFTDTFGAEVSLDRGHGNRSRAGLAADFTNEWIDDSGKVSRVNAYGIANLYYDFAGGTRAQVSGIRFRSEADELWGGLGFGFTSNWSDDRYSLYAEVSANTSLERFGDSHSVKANAGVRIRW